MKIYIGNLALDVTEDELKEIVEPFGQIDKVTIVRNGFSGDSRGFGFVEMLNSAEAQAVIDALNGNNFKGKLLNVSLARQKLNPRKAKGG